MGAITVNQNVHAVSGRHTWLESIHRANMAGRRLMPNSFFDGILFAKDDKGRSVPVPEDIRRASSLYTGTFGMAKAPGKALGARMESRCEHAGSMKTVVVKPSRYEVGLIDTMVTYNHGFAPNGDLFLALVNEKTGKPIRTDEEMGETDTILLNLNGDVRSFRIPKRDGGIFEAVGDDHTNIWVSDMAFLGVSDMDILGLLSRPRIDFYFDPKRRDVYLSYRPSGRFGAVWESGRVDSAGCGSLSVP